jgi:hypothetical protein
MLKDCPVTIALAFAVIITLPMEEVKLDPVTSATVTASTSPIAGVKAVPVYGYISICLYIFIT